MIILNKNTNLKEWVMVYASYMSLLPDPYVYVCDYHLHEYTQGYATVFHVLLLGFAAKYNASAKKQSV